MGCCQAKQQLRNAAETSPVPHDAGTKQRDSGQGRSSSSSQDKRRSGRDAANRPSSVRSSSSDVPGSRTQDGKAWIIMGKYRMNRGKEDIMGEGTSSICRKGVVIETNNPVAIKVYKSSKGKAEDAKSEDVKLQKFLRQVSVLKELQEPMNVPSDPKLWNAQLANSKPSRLFMQLIDHSKDKHGEPGPDPTDGVLYVVTELAQYSLKDYLSLRRDQNRPLPKESVKNITKAIVLVVAGLHAKGLVHVDLKPENLMMFNGRLKLIDVDGCVKIGTLVSIQDSSISFSPCYCAPEWARFLIKDSEARIEVHPYLDVWSVGMTICELVTLDAVLKPMYANFLRNAAHHREAGFLFMDWLSQIKKVPLPNTIDNFEPEFKELLNDWLLLCDCTKRKTLAQCLSNPYILSASESKSKSSKSSRSSAELEGKVDLPDEQPEKHNVRERARREDLSEQAPLFKGTLWKLNHRGNPKDPTDWLKTDMWIASTGSFCYFSAKESKRLVYMDISKLRHAKIHPFEGSAKEFAFEVKTKSDKEDETWDSGIFACESLEDYETWTQKLRDAGNIDNIPTMQLGANMAQDIQAFKMMVKNRRLKVEDGSKDEFEPVFKAKLWKVKAEGDRNKDEDWFEREMWLAKNGSLVYWSKKESRELVYYTSADIARATFKKLGNDEAAKPWGFQVHLPSSGGVEFAPGEFAAETEEWQARWMRNLERFARGRTSITSDGSKRMET